MQNIPKKPIRSPNFYWENLTTIPETSWCWPFRRWCTSATREEAAQYVSRGQADWWARGLGKLHLGAEDPPCQNRRGRGSVPDGQTLNPSFLLKMKRLITIWISSGESSSSPLLSWPRPKSACSSTRFLSAKEAKQNCHHHEASPKLLGPFNMKRSHTILFLLNFQFLPGT